MTGFGIVVFIIMREITSYKVALWYFGNIFIPFGIPKMIVVDKNVSFSGVFKKTSQETLIILVHAVSVDNHKKIRNEVFHHYLKSYIR